MKSVLFICGGLLFLALFKLPIGYYTFLRIVITIGAIAVVIKEFEAGINFWVICFGMIAILFNPLIPVYLNGRSSWIPIDIVSGILFFIKGFSSGFRELK